MADEAVLRVVLEGGGGESPRAAPAGADRPRSAVVAGTGGEDRASPEAARARTRAREAGTLLDGVLDLARKMRGTLGGVFGTLVGSVLDLVALFRGTTAAAQAALPAGAGELFTRALPVAEAQPPFALPADVARRPNVLPPPGFVGPMPEMVGPTPDPRKTTLAGPSRGGPMSLGASPTQLGGRRLNVNPQMELPPVAPPVPPTGGPALPGERPSGPGKFGPWNMVGPGAKYRDVKAGVDPAKLDVGGGASPLAGLGTAAAGITAGLAAANAFAGAIVGAASAARNFTLSLVNPNANIGQSVSQMGQSISSVAGAFGVLLPPVTLFGGLLGAAVEGLGQFISAMDGMVARFAQYSPALAVAEAQSEIVQQLNDIRRAQEATPALVEFLKVRTELQQKFEDAKMRILTRLMPLALKGMEMFEKMLPLIEGLVGVMDTIMSIVDIMGLNVQKMARKQDEDVDIGADVIMQGFINPLMAGPPPRGAVIVD